MRRNNASEQDSDSISGTLPLKAGLLWQRVSGFRRRLLRGGARHFIDEQRDVETAGVIAQTEREDAFEMNGEMLATGLDIDSQGTRRVDVRLRQRRLEAQSKNFRESVRILRNLSVRREPPGSRRQSRGNQKQNEENSAGRPQAPRKACFENHLRQNLKLKTRAACVARALSSTRFAPVRREARRCADRLALRPCDQTTLIGIAPRKSCLPTSTPQCRRIA
jgi:hypothetical protein